MLKIDIKKKNPEFYWKNYNPDNFFRIRCLSGKWQSIGQGSSPATNKDFTCKF